MAIVDYRVDGKQIGMRHFEVPKRAAELKYWYVAAQRALPAMPKYEPRFLIGADITVETIILSWANDNGIRHTVIIARKRRLM